MYPDIQLPPRPVVTRWGTWIEAAVYYAMHFDKVSTFLEALDSEEATSISKAMIAIREPNIKNELAFIKSHFECIPEAIKKLETKGVIIGDAIRTFKSVQANLESIPNRGEFLVKFKSVVGKNTGMTILEKIAHILEGGELDEPDEFIDELSPSELAAMKYAPVTSCDVERTFSTYKRVLEDCRRSFAFENLKKHVMIHCNNFD